MKDPAALRSPAMVRFFGRIMARTMQRSFNGVRLARPGWPDLPTGRPAIVYLNHPAWWDPAFLIVMATTRFADRPGFGPMDAKMIQRFRFMERIGLFGIEPGTRAGGTTFLRTAVRLLADPDAMLWVTAEGAMTDPRTRPVMLRHGVARLLARVPDAVVVPLALEYPFWRESKPEALARFGRPVDTRAYADMPVKEITATLARELERTMDALAKDALSREPARFTLLQEGSAGVGGVYDIWRRARAWATGRRFDARCETTEP
jgi:1-acyl-sn-glycerol-3-phosphate acyltransferase